MKSLFLRMGYFLLSLIIFEFILSASPQYIRVNFFNTIPGNWKNSYVLYVLNKGDGYFRSCARKTSMLDMLFFETQSGYKTQVPRHVIEQYSSRAMLSVFSNCISLEEPGISRAKYILATIDKK